MRLSNTLQLFMWLFFALGLASGLPIGVLVGLKLEKIRKAQKDEF